MDKIEMKIKRFYSCKPIPRLTQNYIIFTESIYYPDHEVVFEIKTKEEMEKIWHGQKNGN